MQETWTFDYDYPLEDIPLENFLNSKSKELGIFLSYYFKKEGAVAERAFLKGKPKFSTSNSGLLILGFDLVYFNACLAIHEKEKSEMELNFQLNEQKKTLELKGAYWPERGMDEI